MADTPNQGAENYGCPGFPKVSCANAGDMSMNYMDYTDDRCMYMFSTGQSTRMNALFAPGGARVGLTTSLGGTALRTALASTLTLYPNPATSTLTLTLPAGPATATYIVRVYDLRGHEMTQARYNGHGQLDISQLPKGLYYLTAGNGLETSRQRFEKE